MKMPRLIRLVGGCLLTLLAAAPTIADDDQTKPAASGTESRLATEGSSTSRFNDPSGRVDVLLLRRWQELEIEPAVRSDDAEFCRRAWLDLAGVAPPIWALQEFLQSDAEDKRSELIDSLLASPRFATHMANRWNEILLPADAESGNREDRESLRQWLRKQFLANTPYDHLVGRFLVAGASDDQAPAVFYTARDVEPVKIASATSRLFLGMRLECAQCHDHPFAKWTQDDFWSFAAFFSQVEATEARMGRGSGIRDSRGKELNFPESDRVMAPRYPGVDQPPESDPTNFRRRQLTIWLASRNNPYFSRAAANRVWAHLFGRGLIDPVDEMDDANPASHPELLQYLADYLVEHRFDLRSLYRMLANTRAYHLSSAIVHGDRPQQDAFAAMNVKTLTAAQYFDSLMQNVYRRNQSSVANDRTSESLQRQNFISRMRSGGAPPTSYPHGIVQALGMMNGPEVLLATGANQTGLIGSLDAPFFDDPGRIDSLFLACLSRLPSQTERSRFLEYLQSADHEGSRESRLADVAWVLLNSAECFVCP